MNHIMLTMLTRMHSVNVKYSNYYHRVLRLYVIDLVSMDLWVLRASYQ